MENKKNLSSLAKKTALVIGSAIAALTGVSSSATNIETFNSNEGKTIEYTNAAKKKTMPVLKLNLANPTLGLMVSSHESHSSHSSHYSHSSMSIS